MLSTNVPTKFPTPFAASAGAGYITTPVPTNSQIGITDGRASLHDGFPPLNFVPEGSGGVPPFGQDMNGILYQATSWVQWLSAGGPVTWDSAFSAQIAGYPKGATVASPVTFGMFFVSLVENNTTNPDTGGAGWKSVALGVGGANEYMDTGVPNALVITPTTDVPAYVNGLTYIVEVMHANTGPCTIKVGSLPVVDIVTQHGTPLTAGMFNVSRLLILTFRDASFQWVNSNYAFTQNPGDNSVLPASTAYADAAVAAGLAQIDTFSGSIYGLTMSNTPGLTTTSVSATVGACRDSTNLTAIDVTAPMAKLLTAIWAAGGGNGGKLPATALAAGQTWHFFAVVNPTSGAYDFAFSQSPTAPEMAVPIAAGFTKFRRIGAVILEASSTNIRQFIQTGSWFMLTTRSADYAATANGQLTATSFYRPITVPVGIVVQFLGVLQSTGTNDNNPYISGVFNPAFGAPPAFGGATQWGQIRRTTWRDFNNSPYNYGYTLFTQFCDASGHVYTACSDPVDFMALGVLGWNDQRGEFYPDP